MKTAWLIILFVCLVSFPLMAQQPTLRDSLLDRLTGEWILKGKIAGKETVHDIKAEWVLEHQYVLIKEISREKKASGEPEYEANVYVGWDQSTNEYICIWIDIWGGVTPQSIGRAKPKDDEIAFVFRDGDNKATFHSTFAYNRNTNTWQWIMDNDDNGKLTAFARVTLTKK